MITACKRWLNESSTNHSNCRRALPLSNRFHSWLSHIFAIVIDYMMSLPCCPELAELHSVYLPNLIESERITTTRPTRIDSGGCRSFGDMLVGLFAFVDLEFLLVQVRKGWK